ncbi:MAG: hypothetical protein GEU90_02895 [Gemmatimonas sp.]|nr:hypothetical protein [Gemmatimonas sp.]
MIHVVPRLVVLPDDPALGEFRQQFAGMLGMIEERPDEGEADQLRVAGFDLIIGSDRFQERLLEGPEDRVNGRAMLRARLLDAILNDRDRHWDQWRWAEFERQEIRYWRPIPEDRDYVFVDFNGILPSLAARVFAHFVSFDDELPTVEELNQNATDMDRRLLAELPRSAWDSTAAFLQAALTEEVIADAVRQLPKPYQEEVGGSLQRTLLARRDALPAFARQWYSWLSSEVDVHGTDAAEIAIAEYQPDGSLEVRLYAEQEGEAAGSPFYLRRFRPDETNEVRIYLHDGNDAAVVRGTVSSSSIGVRVLGGPGIDTLTDSSYVRSGARVSFHDASGDDNQFNLSRHTQPGLLQHRG